MDTIQLRRTSERMLIEQYQSSIEDYVIYLMHLASYQFAESFVRGKRVLDYGCGSGYGSAHTAATAATVDAVDVADDAIVRARAEFPRPNLHFHTIDPLARLPFADSSFETVLSFQVFEHVTDIRHYLSEARRVLVPDGVLLLVTPDRSSRLFPWQRPWNRWHVKEYSAASLAVSLGSFFPRVEIQHMSGRRAVIDVELRRSRKLKWMTLPFTLPIIPDSTRVALLNMLYALRGRPAETVPRQQFDFDVSSIEIGPALSPSVGLVAIARLS